MKQITKKIEDLKEIHVEKMHFRVISRHPQYSIDTANRISSEEKTIAGSTSRYIGHFS